MKIYTKQGDAGKTQVYSTEILRVDKDDCLLESYGNLDELNSHIGLIRALLHEQSTDDESATLVNELKQKDSQLDSVQRVIFNIGFALSDKDVLTENSVADLENYIDEMTKAIPPQTKFILPGGSVISAHIHVARTVTRRTERTLVSLSKHYDTNPIALKYINRLSDYLFTLARWCNQLLNYSETEI